MVVVGIFCLNIILPSLIFRSPFQDENFARGPENLFFTRPIRNMVSNEEIPVRILRATEAGR